MNADANAAIAALSRSDIDQLEALAGRCLGKRRSEAADVVATALMKVLDGSRPWNPKFTLIAHVRLQVKSLAADLRRKGNCPKKGGGDALWRPRAVAYDEDADDPLDLVAGGGLDPEQQLLLDEDVALVPEVQPVGSSVDAIREEFGTMGDIHRQRFDAVVNELEAMKARGERPTATAACNKIGISQPTFHVALKMIREREPNLAAAYDLAIGRGDQPEPRSSRRGYAPRTDFAPAVAEQTFQPITPHSRALFAVIAALEPLEREDRRRVLAATTLFLGDDQGIPPPLEIRGPPRSPCGVSGRREQNG